MVADGMDRKLELTTDEMSRSNAHLLDEFLNRTDFQASLRKDVSDPQPGQLPASEQLLAQLLGGDRKTAKPQHGDNVLYSKKDFRDITINADEVAGSVVVR